MSDTKPTDTRHLRKGLADVNGDGEPDWALPGTGANDAAPDWTDPFILTTAEALARGEDHEIAHRDGDEFGDYVDAPRAKRTIAERIIAGATEISEGPLFGRVFGTPQGRKAFRIACKRWLRFAGRWALGNGPWWLIVRLWWLVRGVGISVAWFALWITDREGLNDVRAIPEAGKRVDSKKTHKAEIWDRFKVAGAVAAAAAAAIGLCLFLPEDPCQPWARLALFALAPAVAGVWLVIIGKPADKRLLGERVHKVGGWSQLTAEQVRQGLFNPGLIKNVADVRFARTTRLLAHGDLIFVQLPPGITARHIMAKRDKLASGLGFLLNQVFPFEATRKDLPNWPVDVSTMGLLVTHKPVSEMALSDFPRWPGLSVVARRGRTDYFKAFPLMHDIRFNPVNFPLAEMNTVVAGRMGVGKSAWLQLILMYAALDPRVQLIVAEFKGVADFMAGEELYSDYVCGVDDEDFERVVEILIWLEQELRRRGALIKAARRAGRAPQGKVTSELASDPGGGLHPILLVIDEFHMLSMHREFGAEAMRLLEQIIKRARALGVHVVLATQIPDAKSVPTSIISSIALRICGGVMGWRANNMVLGDGAYEAGWRATDLKPGNQEDRGDAGFAWFRGILDPMLTHAYYPLPAEVDKVYRYAHTHLRNEQVVGHPADPEAVEPPRDVLYDIQVIITDLGVDKAQWERLWPLMAERWPHAWGHIKSGAQLSAIARTASVARDARGVALLNDDGKEVQLLRSVSVAGGPGNPQGEDHRSKGCKLDNLKAAREALADHALPSGWQRQAITAGDDDDLADDLAATDKPQASPGARSKATGPSKASNVVAVAPVRSAAWDDNNLAPVDPDDDNFAGDEPPQGPDDANEPEPVVPAPRLQREEDGGMSVVQMAAQIVVTTQFGSAPMLKRKLKVTDGRAAQLLSLLEDRGIVGPADPFNPAKARDVLIPPSDVDDAIEALRGAGEVP